MVKQLVFIYADNADFAATDDIMMKFMKKAVILKNYKGGDLEELKQIGGYQEVAVSAISEEFMEKNPVLAVTVSRPQEALPQIFDASDRNTLIIVIAGMNVAFYGLGINGKLGGTDREAYARDIAPTACYIVDAHLPENPMGAILYQILKDQNLKASELAKAQEAIESMEMAIERKTRNPWDKHDCA